MHKFKKGQLRSGSQSGPVVKNRKQAIAIMLSEKKQAAKGKKEYQPKGFGFESIQPARTKNEDAE